MWEKNYAPVVIANKIIVRAPFHEPSKQNLTEIIVEPGMAFGTGHHPTTEMVAGYLLEMDIRGQFLFDMGCGSGILGILAAKTGAGNVIMADNDPDSVSNAMKNIALNNLQNISVFCGSTELLSGYSPGIITANINKPVLIRHAGHYYKALKPGGLLVTSGVLETDFEDVMNAASGYGFRMISRRLKKKWLMLVFTKPC